MQGLPLVAKVDVYVDDFLLMAQTASTHYMPGPVNVMADNTSRRWDLSDDALLTHFNTHYPHARSWQMRMLSPATNALLIGTLSKTRSSAASPLGKMPLPTPPGPSGRPSILQLFAYRYHNGALAPGRHPVRSRTVEDAIRALGQTYAGMGSVDPRLNQHGALDFRLTRPLFQAWKHDDDPPSCVMRQALLVLEHRCPSLGQCSC